MDDNLVLTRSFSGELFSFTPEVWSYIRKSAKADVLSWLSQRRHYISESEYRSLLRYAENLIDNVR